MASSASSLGSGDDSAVYSDDALLDDLPGENLPPDASEGRPSHSQRDRVGPPDTGYSSAYSEASLEWPAQDGGGVQGVPASSTATELGAPAGSLLAEVTLAERPTGLLFDEFTPAATHQTGVRRELTSCIRVAQVLPGGTAEGALREGDVLCAKGLHTAIQFVPESEAGEICSLCLWLMQARPLFRVRGAENEGKPSLRNRRPEESRCPLRPGGESMAERSARRNLSPISWRS